MKAGLFERLGLLLRADAHGVLESLEERSLLAKQLLREAELEVARKRARSEAIERESARLAAESARAEDDLRRLDADVELALARGEDELARFAARKLLLEQRRGAARRARAEALGRERAELVERLARQEVELAELRQRVADCLSEEATRSEPGVVEGCLAPVAEHDVSLELLRRRTGTGGPS
jgi:phage shock protein A